MDFSPPFLSSSSWYGLWASALAGFGRVRGKDALATPRVWGGGGHAVALHRGFLLCPLLSDRLSRPFFRCTALRC